MNIKCLNCRKEIEKTYKGRKYCCSKCQHEFERKEWERKLLSGEIDGFHKTDHWGNIPDRKCSKCGWGMG